MFLQLYNELEFSFRIKATSPLLIRDPRFEEARKEWSGNRDDLKKKMPNVIPLSRATTSQIKQAVLNSDPLTAVGQLPFFVPAASFRGVARSHIERIVRSFDTPEAPKICDLFEEDESVPLLSCSTALELRRDRLKQRNRSDEFHPYQPSCPVCRLFGSTLQASRIVFSDGAQVPGTGRVVQREHVRINRRTGGVGGPPLKFLGLEHVQFDMSIIVRNFELPQVVMLGAFLADLKFGNVTLGAGKSKGYGRISLQAPRVFLRYLGPGQAPDDLRGVAEHHMPEQRAWFQKRYGVQEGKPVALPAGNWTTITPWRSERELPFAEFEEMWRGLDKQWESVRPLHERLVVEQ